MTDLELDDLALDQAHLVGGVTPPRLAPHFEGPFGTKLILSEILHEAAAIMTDLQGPEGAFMDGDAVIGNSLVLMHRGLSIAGGTSEIKRNQIGERIVGLPRDPLIK